MNPGTVNPSNPGQIGSNVGVNEQANATGAQPAVGVGAQQPIELPKKPNYVMYAGIALAVIVVGYLVYKYAIKKD